MYLRPTHKKTIERRIENLSSLFVDKRGIYVSGPLTTGKEFVKWYKEYGRNIPAPLLYRENHFKHVISQNIEKMLSFVNGMPEAPNEIIIEPATFEVDGWSQADYLYYWEMVIDCYIEKIVFIDEWYYSNGCIYEYYTGLKKGIELLDQKMDKIVQSEAISLIKESIAEYKQNAIRVDFQEELLKKIERI